MGALNRSISTRGHQQQRWGGSPIGLQTRWNGRVGLGGWTGVLLLAAAAGGCERRVSESPPLSVATSTPESGPTPCDAELRRREAAVVAYPNSTSARGDLALFLHANDRREDAARQYDELQRRDPGDARWPYLLARIRQDEGDTQAAARLLAEAASRDPTNGLIAYRLAESAFKRGDIQTAEEFYRGALTTGGPEAHVRLGLARVGLQRGDAGSAEEHLQAVLRADPTLASAHALLAAIRETRGESTAPAVAGAVASRRFREPDDPWLDALADLCCDVEKLAVLADIAAEAGRRGRAVELLRSSLVYDFSRGRTHLSLGKVLLMEGKRAEARASIVEAIRWEPTLAEAHFELVAELETAGNAPAALAAADAAVAAAPDNSGLHRQRGVLLQALHRPESAEAALRRSVALDQADAQNLEALGNFLWAQRREAEAVEQFERARAASRLAVKPRALLAGYYLERGRLKDAAACLREAQEIEPSLPGLREVGALYHLREGNDALRAGQFARAEGAYRKSLDRAPAYEEAWTGLVALWQRTGRAGEARSRLTQLIERQPQLLFAYGLAARVALQAGDRAGGLAWIDRGLAAARTAHDHRQQEALLSLRSRVTPK